MKMMAHATVVQGADLQQMLQIRQHMAVEQAQIARMAEKVMNQNMINPVAASSGGSSVGQNLDTRA